MTSEFLKPISGKRLSKLYREYIPILFPKLVSKSPELATERAENFFGTELTQAANNIPALAQLRNYIYDNSTEKRYIDSFIIVLPHTHWEKLAPIIYTFDKPSNRYIIGPHALEDTQVYIPVSFTFYQGIILPYEWADETIGIDPIEFETCLNIIQKVAKKYNYNYFPFGIALDFRFKETLFSTFGGTVEIPEEDEDSLFAGCSYILAQSEYDRNNMKFSLSQVAWHPRSDKLLSLNKAEMAVLSELRTLLNNATSETERQAILAEIEKQLNL